MEQAKSASWFVTESREENGSKIDKVNTGKAIQKYKRSKVRLAALNDLAPKGCLHSS